CMASPLLWAGTPPFSRFFPDLVSGHVISRGVSPAQEVQRLRCWRVRIGPVHGQHLAGVSRQLKGCVTGDGAGDHLPAVTAFSSSSDARMSCGRSGWLDSLTQRSKATLKTAMPASAVRL